MPVLQSLTQVVHVVESPEDVDGVPDLPGGARGGAMRGHLCEVGTRRDGEMLVAQQQDRGVVGSQMRCVVDEKARTVDVAVNQSRVVPVKLETNNNNDIRICTMKD